MPPPPKKRKKYNKTRRNFVNVGKSSFLYSLSLESDCSLIYMSFIITL